MPQGNPGGYFAGLRNEFNAGADLGRDIRGLAKHGQTPRQEIEGADSARFMDNANMDSLLHGALQASQYTTLPERQEYLRKRIIAGRERGRNMDDSLGLWEIGQEGGLEEQNKMISELFQIGERTNRLKQRPGRTTPPALRTIEGLDEQGNPTTFAFDPGSGGYQDLGIKPVPPRGATREEVRDQTTGNVIWSRGGNGEFPPEQIGKKLRADITKELYDAGKFRSALGVIANEFEDEFATYMGGAKAYLDQKLDKFMLPSPDGWSDFADRRRAWQIDVDQQFNEYRRRITGAAASVIELESLKKAFMNTDLGPRAFRAALNKLTSETDRLMRLQRRVLREGLGDNFHEDSPAARRLDELFDPENPQDDDPNARIRDLVKTNPNARASDLLNQMRSEGYEIP